MSDPNSNGEFVSDMLCLKPLQHTDNEFLWIVMGKTHAQDLKIKTVVYKAVMALRKKWSIYRQKLVDYHTRVPEHIKMACFF